MLYIQDLPVTTKYNAEIIRASHTPEIRDYYHQKYQWSDKTMATLDWDAYNRAMKRMKTSEERTLHKFTHNWLPTGNHMAKRYHTENKCPHCQQPENNRHIVNCPKQKEQQEKFYRNLAKRLEAIHTDNTLKNLLLNSLQGKELSVKNDHKNKHWMEQLIQEQNQIGIQNLWLGHLTQTWGDIQEHIYRQQGQHHSRTGTRWATTVITQIFKHVLSCWRQRNETLHKHLQTPAPYQEAIQKDIEELYNKYRGTLEVLPSLYKHKLQDLLQKPLKYLLRWHQLMQPMNRHAILQQKQRPGQDIRQFFQQKPTP